jgi:hypothetical protein
MIVGTLAGLAKSVGAQVRTEPDLGPALVEEKALDGTSELRAEPSSLRGDLLIIKGGERIIVDVTVPRSTAPSNRARGAVPGAVIAEAERFKASKYEEACKERGYKFSAFGMESHGGLGVSARELLCKLAAHSYETEAKAFVRDAVIRLSVVLQRGNAMILKAGMERQALATALGGLDRPLGGGGCAGEMQSARRKGWYRVGMLGEVVDMSAAFHEAATHAA